MQVKAGYAFSFKGGGPLMPSYDTHAIEAKWQEYWERNKTFQAPDVSPKKKLYVLDMFPYPSGEGLHVGHPEGYSATDMFCRFQRMRGYNVLHPMGYDAFGLPAEQYAIETGTHPRITTERNIANIRRQIKRLGFSYDWDREFASTDTGYMRWTQWIFLTLFDTWFDRTYEWTDTTGRKRIGKGRPLSEMPIPEAIRAQGEKAMRLYQDSFRLAYQAESPVNWCAALGTVLADEEVINGRSERGDHPVQRIPLRQWMLRITSYADRLVEDLATLQWPESIKKMQQDWVGRSEGAEVDFFIGQEASFKYWMAARSKSGFPKSAGEEAIRIYTTRPDTLFGATYMVLAPEHPLVDQLTTGENRARVDAYRQRVAETSEEDRIAGRGEKSGVFTGGFAVNPVTGEKIPIWIADYVLISYGTGAIMAVPGHDQRDLEFARAFQSPCACRRDPCRRLAAHHARQAERNAADAAHDRELCAANRRTAGGIRRRRHRDAVRESGSLPERAADAAGESDDHRMACPGRNRARGHQVQIARLALQPAAVLGRTDSNSARARCGRESDGHDQGGGHGRTAGPST